MVVKMVTGFDAKGNIVEDLDKAKQLLEAEFDEDTGFLIKERVVVVKGASMIIPK